MTPERRKHLDLTGDELTEEEFKAGWHYCYAWDFMLIHKDEPEAECCECAPALDAAQAKGGEHA